MLIQSFVLTTTLFAAVVAHAHTPLVLCTDNGDKTIACQGGFSDGSSAAGVAMHIKAADGRVLLEGRMNDDSEFTFDKPRGDFSVIFIENERREFHGLIITRQGGVFLISWDDYRLIPLPVAGYDPAHMDFKLLIDPYIPDRYCQFEASYCWRGHGCGLSAPAQV